MCSFGVRHFPRLANATAPPEPQFVPMKLSDDQLASVNIHPGLWRCHLAPWIRLSRSRDRENGGMAALPCATRRPITSVASARRFSCAAEL
jgi:hypothetical protein